VSACKTPLPRRRVVIRPALRNIAAWWLAVAGETWIRRASSVVVQPSPTASSAAALVSLSRAASALQRATESLGHQRRCAALMSCSAGKKITTGLPGSLRGSKTWTDRLKTVGTSVMPRPPGASSRRLDPFSACRTGARHRSRGCNVPRSLSSPPSPRTRALAASSASRWARIRSRALLHGRRLGGDR
jgi:hypothetical protein